MLSDDDTTTNTYELTTDDITTEKSFQNNFLFTTVNNVSYNTTYHTLSKLDDSDTDSTIKHIFSFIVIIFVIIICIGAVFRHIKHLPKRRNREEDSLQTVRLYAHPFEEVAIAVGESQAIELDVVSPTATTTTTTSTNTTATN